MSVRDSGLLPTFGYQEVSIPAVPYTNGARRIEDTAWPVLTLLLGVVVFLTFASILRFFPEDVQKNGWVSTPFLIVALGVAALFGTWFYKWKRQTISRKWDAFEKSFGAAITKGLEVEGYNIRHAGYHLERRVVKHKSGAYYRVLWGQYLGEGYHLTLEPYYGDV